MRNFFSSQFEIYIFFFCRENILRLCCANLQARRSILQSLQVLKSIMESFQLEKEDLLFKLLENSSEFSLIQSWLIESEQYRNFVEEKKILTEENSGNIRTLGIFTHTEHIQTRLEFFRYVIVTFKFFFARLDVTILQTLWKIYVEKAGKMEREISLELFGSILQAVENFGAK